MTTDTQAMRQDIKERLRYAEEKARHSQFGAPASICIEAITEIERWQVAADEMKMTNELLVKEIERLRAVIPAHTADDGQGKWIKMGLASEEFIIDHVKHGEICRGIEGDWLAVYHTRHQGRFETPGEARAAVAAAHNALQRQQVEKMQAALQAFVAHDTDDPAHTADHGQETLAQRAKRLSQNTKNEHYKITSQCLEYCAREIERLEAAVSALERQVPDGWQLVPKEPTEEMVRQGGYARRHVDMNRNTEATWSAMLSAAPQIAEQRQEKS